MRVSFRFYEELNDALPPARRKVTFGVSLPPGARVEAALRSLGVDSDTVDLVLVNGEPADFSRPLANGDRVSVYPVFESLDVSAVSRLRPKPLRALRFLAEPELGALTRLLRFLGFDASSAAFADREAYFELAEKQSRVILSASRHVPARATRAHRVTASKPHLQLLEVLDRFDLGRAAEPLSRCPRCNGAFSWATAASCPACGWNPPGRCYLARARRLCEQILSGAGGQGPET